MTSMINDTLYAKYIKERENFDVIENDYCFILYKIKMIPEANNSNECFISHAFTDPVVRKDRRMSALMNELEEYVFSHAKCDRITATIDLRDKNASISLLASLKYGFKVILAENGIIFIQKVIKFENAKGISDGNG